MEETKEMVSICYITGEGGSVTAAPRLCLHLHRNEAVVSRVAQQLLDHCLEKLPDAPARKEVGKGLKLSLKLVEFQWEMYKSIVYNHIYIYICIQKINMYIHIYIYIYMYVHTHVSLWFE